MKARAEEAGFFEPLGPDHHAHFLETDGDALLVTFESHPAISMLSPDDRPLGEAVAEAHGWSHLAVIARGDTWFREGRVYGFFDQLNDDGFFDEFETILFYGAGPCGYAACAFSVSAPGARVLALQPQATLDPRITEWDDRFVGMRRRSFTDRYGFAPDMLDAAQAAWIVYDPREPLDAMHAALFARRNVTRFRLPSMGNALQADLLGLDIHDPLMAAAMDGTLDTETFARLARRRRDYVPYLRRLLSRLEADERLDLVRLLCRNVTGRMRAPRFRRRLKALEAADATGATADTASDGAPDSDDPSDNAEPRRATGL
ncbi:phosphoadenosine phosphosulfate reductase [Roseivivax jejudonensis]|nr:phosphoadenosine phosphosulfate reductase [Roseivivax jejudonensis]